MHATAPESVIQLDTPTAVLAGNPFSAAPPPSTSVEQLLPGTAGTFQTLEAMKQCVLGNVPPDFSGFNDNWVRSFALSLVKGCNAEPRCEFERVFNFVTRNIQYVPHPIDQQVVQDCRRTIELGSGDCVSMSVCVATLLASLGYWVQFIAQYYSDQTLYSHVYVMTCDEDLQEIRLDPVAKDKPMGWSQSLPDGGFETAYEVF